MRRSGQSQRVFCSERNLALATFQWWRAKLRHAEGRESATAFLPLALNTAVPVVGAAIEADLRSKTRLRLEGEAALRALEALGSGWLRSFGTKCQPLCGPIAGTASAAPLVNRSRSIIRSHRTSMDCHTSRRSEAEPRQAIIEPSAYLYLIDLLEAGVGIEPASTALQAAA